MPRPYWTGQIRISLVSFPVTLAGAIKRSAQVPLHELDRNTGERIKHRNVNESGDEVEREDIVKAFETSKGDYVQLEEEEIDKIKLPSSDTLELDVFTPFESIPLMRFERPYFILPGNKDAGDIYATFHEALLSSKKAGIGQLTMRGREELCAVVPVEKGLMLHTLRYNAELQKPDDFLPEPRKKLKQDYIDLAEQLIKKNTHAPHFEQFHDHYHEALLELIAAKKAHRKPKLPKPGKAPAKVIDFADALRKSLGVKEKTKSSRKAPHKRKSA